MRNNRTTIYLDTMIWNQMHDQRVVPDRFSAELAARGGVLVLSDHNIYELAKTFTSEKPTFVDRGRELVTYLRQHLDHMLFTKPPMELVVAEMYAAKRRSADVEAFVDDDNLAIVRTEIDDLAAANMSERAKDYIVTRLAEVKHDREGAKKQLETNPHLREELEAVAEIDLPVWLRRQARLPNGIFSLARRIQNNFPDVDIPIRDAEEYARHILFSSAYSAGAAFVRQDLYCVWRCAHCDLLRRDLLDDMKHVMSAAYCDIYVTSERGQADYAGLLVDGDKLKIYDRNVPIDEWLFGLLTSSS